MLFIVNVDVIFFYFILFYLSHSIVFNGLLSSGTRNIRASLPRRYHAIHASTPTC